MSDKKKPEKISRFKPFRRRGIILSIIAIVVAIIIFQSYSNENINTNTNTNQSAEQLIAQSRAESIQRFQTQFCGLNSKANNTIYISEVSLPRECLMPVGIYVDDAGNVAQNNTNNTPSDSNIWFISTKNGTLYRYSTGEGFREYVIPEWLTRQRPTDSSMVWTVKKDSEGNLWFTDEEQNSLWKFNLNTTSFEKFIIPTSSQGIENSYPVSFDFDTQGNIYFGGIRVPSLWFGNTTEMTNNSSAGIYEIPLPIESFSEQERQSLSLGSIYLQDKTNTVWISLLSFGNKGQIQGYNIENRNITEIFPLPSDLTSPVGMTEDSEGNLWVTDHGTSIFFKLNPISGNITKYVTSQVDQRITGNNTMENAYTLPYWIERGDNATLWFNEHTGNKIAKFIPSENKLVEYWIPTQNKLFGMCQENEICGIANALQFSANNNNSVWFTEWSENKIGQIKSNHSIPVDVRIDKENITLRRGDSAEIVVNIKTNYTNREYKGNNIWEMKDSTTIKENGSLNGTGLVGQFSQHTLTLDAGQNTISYILTASEDITPGRYTLMLGIGNKDIVVMRAVNLNIL